MKTHTKQQKLLLMTIGTPSHQISVIKGNYLELHTDDKDDILCRKKERGNCLFIMWHRYLPSSNNKVSEKEG